MELELATENRQSSGVGMGTGQGRGRGGSVEWELRTMYCMWYSGEARGGCKKFEVFENMRSSQFAQAWGGKGEQKGRRGGRGGAL